MTKKNKSVALVLAIAVFFALMLSVNVISHRAEHECAGNGCQICQQVESSRQILNMLTAGIFAIAIALTLLCAGRGVICCAVQSLPQGTLVALKVELLN